uniref:Uncharacterized protein n=1 Tax=Romanomermis culicivorax TaxID=13658 RepID=A0A915KJ64_ROMCU
MMGLASERKKGSGRKPKIMTKPNIKARRKWRTTRLGFQPDNWPKNLNKDNDDVDGSGQLFLQLEAFCGGNGADGNDASLFKLKTDGFWLKIALKRFGTLLSLNSITESSSSKPFIDPLKDRTETRVLMTKEEKFLKKVQEES